MSKMTSDTGTSRWFLVCGLFIIFSTVGNAHLNLYLNLQEVMRLLGNFINYFIFKFITLQILL